VRAAIPIPLLQIEDVEIPDVVAARREDQHFEGRLIGGYHTVGDITKQRLKPVEARNARVW
jgi:hypothetical protein